MKGMFWHPVLLIRGKYPAIQYQFGGIFCKMPSKNCCSLVTLHLVKGMIE
jgi:hypothetical protein